MIVIAGFILLLMSCSPEKRVAHFQHKINGFCQVKPELCPVDVITEKNWITHTCDSVLIPVPYQEASFDTSGIVPDWVKFNHTQRKGALSETLNIANGVITETAYIDSGAVWKNYDRAHEFTERKAVKTSIEWKEVYHYFS